MEQFAERADDGRFSAGAFQRNVDITLACAKEGRAIW